MALGIGDILAPGIMETKRRLEDRDRLMALFAVLGKARQPEMFEGVTAGEPTPEDIANYERAFGISFPQGAGLPRGPMAQEIYRMLTMAAPRGQATAIEEMAGRRGLQELGIGDILPIEAEQRGGAMAAGELARRRGLLEGGASELLRQEQLAAGRGRAAEEGGYLGDLLDFGILDKGIEAWKRRRGAEYEWGQEHPEGPIKHWLPTAPDIGIGPAMEQMELDKLKAGAPGRAMEAASEQVKWAHETVFKILGAAQGSEIINFLAQKTGMDISKNPTVMKFLGSPGVPAELKKVFNQAVEILNEYYAPSEQKGWKHYGGPQYGGAESYGSPIQ